jgi:endonuclease/exonuclease/phosphatase family metal-dependent hydrolase
MIVFFVFLGYGLFFGVTVALFFQWGTLWPKPVEIVPVYPRIPRAPVPESKRLRVLSWNVQFFAGREPVFFYDVPSGDRPRALANRDAIARNLQEAARVIQEVDPDVIFLQEVDDGATRTYRENQTQRLLELLPAEKWPWYAEAWYWKAAFIPHPKIMGSAGMKLVTLSRLPLERLAYRRALPEMPHGWLESRFQLKRAILETRVSEGPWKGLMLLNTHLDAFAQGFDTMDRQVEIVKTRLDALSADGTPWVIAGDFNLLVPGALEKLSPEHRVGYRPDRTELSPLLGAYSSFPSQAQALQPEHFTFWTKDPSVTQPDRVLDYFFHSKLLSPKSARVLQHEARNLSDHFPILIDLA